MPITLCTVLGTAQAAWDLLEKRSEIYSSRPRFIVAYVSSFMTYLNVTAEVATSGEILSDNKRGLMLPNNEHWRKWRKVGFSEFS